MTVLIIKGQKRKKTEGNRSDETHEMMMVMEKRADEREEKMIKLYGEIEAKRRETKRKHETAMTRMFMEFMERIATSSYPSIYPQQPFNHSPYYPQ